MDVITGCECSLACSFGLLLNSRLASCEGAVLWRGHFNAAGNEKSVNLSINGGEGNPSLSVFIIGTQCLSITAFGASIWFNGVFINSTSGR